MLPSGSVSSSLEVFSFVVETRARRSLVCLLSSAPIWRSQGRSFIKICTAKPNKLAYRYPPVLGESLCLLSSQYPNIHNARIQREPEWLWLQSWVSRTHANCQNCSPIRLILTSSHKSLYPMLQTANSTSLILRQSDSSQSRWIIWWS